VYSANDTRESERRGALISQSEKYSPRFRILPPSECPFGPPIVDPGAAWKVVFLEKRTFSVRFPALREETSTIRGFPNVGATFRF
jgi:hypothetical protein